MKARKIFCVVIAACLLFGFSACKKEGQVEIKGVADLDGKKIGVQAGTTGEMWVEENVKDVKLSSFKSGIDASLDLLNGSIDAVVLDELPATEIVKRNSKLKIVRDPTFTQNKEEYAIAIKKGNTELVDAINSTINLMKENGEYEALINVFMPIEGEIVVPASENVSGNSVIKMGTNAAFPPFEYVEGNKVVGFDVTIGEKIATSMGKTLQIEDMDFDSLIPALQSGTIDFIIAGMSVTEERKQNVDFSVPYYASEQVIIVRK